MNLFKFFTTRFNLFSLYYSAPSYKIELVDLVEMEKINKNKKPNIFISFNILSIFCFPNFFWRFCVFLVFFRADADERFTELAFCFNIVSQTRGRIYVQFLVRCPLSYQKYLKNRVEKPKFFCAYALVCKGCMNTCITENPTSVSKGVLLTPKIIFISFHM